MGWQWPASESGALSVAMPPGNLLREVTIIFITSTIIWSQVKQQEGTQAGQSTENWIRDLLNMSMVAAAMKLKEACLLEEKL